MHWILAAVGTAFFAGVVAVLAKLGIQTTDSDVATALRTTVVLVFTWLIAILTGSLETASSVTGKTWLLLVLSGLTASACWLCYFRALALGDVNKVVPIDKSSAVITSLLAIVLFGETAHLFIKLACIAAILAGTLMMIQRAETTSASPTGNSWLLFAVLSALFAALSSVLGKVGIDGIDSNLGTAVRTSIIFVASWLMVPARGKTSELRHLNKRELVFLALSGVATALSWLCYYYALQNGVVSVVVQIDKLSLLVAVGFARLVLGERLTRTAAAGLALLVAGTALMTAFA